MNPSKKRGTRFESLVVDYLTAHGHPYTERKAQRGAHDQGDLTGIPGWCLECKATKTIDLASAMNEVVTERDHAGAAYGAAIIKRRGAPIGTAYVVMSLSQFAELIRDNPPPTAHITSPGWARNDQTSPAGPRERDEDDEKFDRYIEQKGTNP